MNISIIICCYNSENRLPETIKFISKLQESYGVEIIVVDNCSRDSTSKIAEIELNRFADKINYRIVYEPNPGLNNARKKGCDTAKYDWLLFCDDDNLLEENYLVSFVSNLEKHPSLSILGCGVSTPEFEKQPEKWFTNYEYLCAIFNIEDQQKNVIISTSIDEECFICGVGMFVKKELLIAYFSDNRFKLSDRTGTQLSSGGDTDLVWYALTHNYLAGQFSNLKLKHYITANRVTKKYILKLYTGISFSFALLNYKYKGKLDKPQLIPFVYSFLNNLLHFNFFISWLQYEAFLTAYKAYNFLKKIDSSNPHHL